MAIKSISSLTAKLNAVLNPALQLAIPVVPLNLSSAISSLISSVTLPKNSTINLSGLSTSLPKIMDMLSSLSAQSNAGGTATALNSIMQTLQPLLQSLNSSTSSAQKADLLQSLPTVVNSMQTLVSSFTAQKDIPINISSALTAIKPLLSILSSADSNSDVTKLISTLNQVLEIAQPMIQNISSGHADLGTLAQSAAQALMPLLTSINTGNSNIDMAKLQLALPAVVGSITTLVTALTQANQGNIPETISAVIKGINPLLKVLENSGSLDSSQADTVHKVYDVLNSVKTILDFVNEPSLLTLSSDLNHVIDSLKPVIAMMDQKGDLSALLDHIEIPDLSGLLADAHKPELISDSIQNALQSISNPSTQELPNISELLQNLNINTGAISLSQINHQAVADTSTAVSTTSGTDTATGASTTQNINTLPAAAMHLDLDQSLLYV
ncbi:hypothetical protein [Acinetobacter sp. ANC 3813]|uniref:hypothetical protein n=1 Tax=Acinetobacter sp. ANC 3813 TaxID=1977873 RepID=UPI000A34E521|nr:hypothetical protein [Acinetobacter sp. ANC 3813]OTG91818.1 hypothetical protein B9T34_00240 [Acinetobacter sp. ANC 3813]